MTHLRPVTGAAIVGRGMLAHAMAPVVQARHGCIAFASGVSNSTETDPAAFAREEALLREHLQDPRTLLYFSSCGVADEHEARRPYIRHKLAMEALVRAHGGRIVRLPQVVGRTDNPHTLTNYLRDRIVRGEHFDLWANAERNLVDVDDVVRIVAALLDKWPEDRRTVTIASPASTPMPKIVAVFEQVLGRKANYTSLDLGRPMPVDTALARSIAARIGIGFDARYLERVIGKYYG
ncbi:NAD-dependent epimerase/dehydratase family protein [Noviluteimonas gilva]|nr:NAD-dependent epimerase/dehydratase family protein [Lysobacter gilvus]